MTNVVALYRDKMHPNNDILVREFLLDATGPMDGYISKAMMINGYLFALANYPYDNINDRLVDAEEASSLSSKRWLLTFPSAANQLDRTDKTAVGHVVNFVTITDLLRRIVQADKDRHHNDQVIGEWIRIRIYRNMDPNFSPSFDGNPVDYLHYICIQFESQADELYRDYEGSLVRSAYKLYPFNE